jgi:hypothetical protein
MRFTKFAFAVVVAFAFGNAYAFHDGGVAKCEGCHTMHNSLNNKAMTGTANTGMVQFASGPYLLKANDQSSACLNCHESATDTGPNGYHISTATSKLTGGSAPLQRTPGGDFGWLKKSYVYTGRSGTPTTWNGYGHNIIGVDYGYTAAIATTGGKAETNAPGNGYDKAQFYCSSCHDPHGRFRQDGSSNVANVDGGGSGTVLPIVTSGSYGPNGANGVDGVLDPGIVAGATTVGAYRLLAGVGYKPKSYAAAPAFTAAPPLAIAPQPYNRTEASSQTRVVYGKGMSEWCGNCHSNMVKTGYTSGMGGLVHPAGSTAVLPDFIIANYNSYVKSGDLTGSGTTSYTSLVPFEEGVADIAGLNAPALTAKASLVTPVNSGPTSGKSNVMCLSCHRAHASAFPSMTRYMVDVQFMTVADSAGIAEYPVPGITDTTNDASIVEQSVARGMPQVDQAAAYYDRPATNFAPFQRVLCNKCHAKD